VPSAEPLEASWAAITDPLQHRNARTGAQWQRHAANAAGAHLVSPPPTLWRPPLCRRCPGGSSTNVKLSKGDYLLSTLLLPVSTFDFPPSKLSTLSSGRHMTCCRADGRRQRMLAFAADEHDGAPSSFYHNDHPCSQVPPPPPRRFIEPAIPTTLFPRWRA